MCSSFCFSCIVDSIVMRNSPIILLQSLYSFFQLFHENVIGVPRWEIGGIEGNKVFKVSRPDLNCLIMTNCLLSTWISKCFLFTDHVEVAKSEIWAFERVFDTSAITPTKSNCIGPLILRHFQSESIWTSCSSWRCSTVDVDTSSGSVRTRLVSLSVRVIELRYLEAVGSIRSLVRAGGRSSFGGSLKRR